MNNQLTLFLVGICFAAVGGLMIGNAVFWRLHARRVEGEIIGARRSGQYFHTVYRYLLPGGESHDGTSIVGHTSLGGRLTGARVLLQVMPARPNEVQEARSPVPTLLGVCFLLIGSWIAYFALTAWPMSIFGWVIGGCFLLYSALKTWHILFPGDRRASLAAWKSVIAQRHTALVPDTPIQRIEDLQQQPQGSTLQVRAGGRRSGVIFVVAGILVIAVGFIPAYRLIELRSSGLRAPGTVLSLEAESSRTGAVYFPVVAFTAANGLVVHFRDTDGSNPPAFHAGESVTVMYQSGDPQQTATIDRGVFNWSPVVLTALLGVVMFSVGLLSLRSKSA